MQEREFPFDELEEKTMMLLEKMKFIILRLNFKGLL